MKIVSIEKSGKVVFAKATEKKLKVEGKNTVMEEFTEDNIPDEVLNKLPKETKEKVKEAKDKKKKDKK